MSISDFFLLGFFALLGVLSFTFDLLYTKQKFVYLGIGSFLAIGSVYVAFFLQK